VLLLSGAKVLRKYSDDQERDEFGRFAGDGDGVDLPGAAEAGGGGGGGGSNLGKDPTGVKPGRAEVTRAATALASVWKERLDVNRLPAAAWVAPNGKVYGSNDMEGHAGSAALVLEKLGYAAWVADDPAGILTENFGFARISNAGGDEMGINLGRVSDLTPKQVNTLEAIIYTCAPTKPDDPFDTGEREVFITARGGNGQLVNREGYEAALKLVGKSLRKYSEDQERDEGGRFSGPGGGGGSGNSLKVVGRGEPSTKKERALVEKLGNVGGATVVWLGNEPDAAKIESRGVRVDGKGAKLVEGEPNACHSNTVTLYLAGKVDQIVTGYALSKDDMWRQHTWGLKGDRVVETTVLRDVYFGFTLTGPEAADFVQENRP
jgi:hypothetical protein